MITEERNRIEALFSNAPWLRDHDPSLGQALMEHTVLHRRLAGEWIYAEGDPATGLTIVLDGLVRIYCGTADGHSCLIGQAGPGTILGQAVRFGGGPRLHTLVAAEDCTLLKIADTAIETIASQRPDVWRFVVAILYAQLEGTLQVFLQSIALPPRRRVAARLLMLADANAQITLSQAALAEMLGITRKTVSQHLGEFERAGLVKRGYNYIAILQRDRLDHIASG